MKSGILSGFAKREKEKGFLGGKLFKILKKNVTIFKLSMQFL